MNVSSAVTPAPVPTAPGAPTPPPAQAPTYVSQRPLSIPGMPKAGDPTPLELGAQPAAGSPASIAEIELQRATQAKRTPELDTWAKKMNDEGILDLWWNEMSDLRKSVSTLHEVQVTGSMFDSIAAAGRVSDYLKKQNLRERPFNTPGSGVQNVLGLDADQFSYPSGHAATSYAAARLLSWLNPAKQEHYFNIAEDVATARVYAGMHFASDIVAGARLGVQQADNFASSNREWINEVRQQIDAGSPVVFSPEVDQRHVPPAAAAPAAA